jgi:hypothetical protein
MCSTSVLLYPVRLTLTFFLLRAAALSLHHPGVCLSGMCAGCAPGVHLAHLARARVCTRVMVSELITQLSGVVSVRAVTPTRCWGAARAQSHTCRHACLVALMGRGRITQQTARSCHCQQAAAGSVSLQPKPKHTTRLWALALRLCVVCPRVCHVCSASARGYDLSRAAPPRACVRAHAADSTVWRGCAARHACCSVEQVGTLHMLFVVVVRPAASPCTRGTVTLAAHLGA